MPTSQLVPEQRSQASRNVRAIFEGLADQPISPKFINAISGFSKRNRHLVADAIIMLAKEVNGVSPILSPDFEIIHAYLYPSQQSERSTTSPSQARFVLDMFPGQIVLLPGTARELIFHTEKTYALLDRLRKRLADVSERKSGLADKFTQLLRDVEQFAGTQNSERNTLSIDPEGLIKEIASFTQGLTLGLGRLYTLLDDSRIVSLSELKEDFAFSDSRRESICQVLSARLAAITTKRTRLSNRHDAESLAAAIEINAHQQLKFLDSLVDDKRSHELFELYYVTNTHSLLKLPIDDYAPDLVTEVLIDQGQLVYEYLESPPSCSWRPQSLSSLEVYCHYRNSESNPQAALERACEEFKVLMDASSLSFDLHRRWSKQKGIKGPASPLLNTEEIKRLSGVCYLLSESQNIDENGRIEVNSRASLVGPRELSQHDMSPNWLRPDAADYFEHGDADTAVLDLLQETLASGKISFELLKKIGVSKTSFNMPSDQEAHRFEMRSHVTSELLLRIDTWVRDHFTTISWSTRSDFTQAVGWIKSICVPAERVNGVFLATYDCARYELKAENTKNLPNALSAYIDSLPDSFHFISKAENALALKSTSFRRTRRDQVFYPETLSLMTDVGEVHVVTPFGMRREVGVTCHFRDLEAIWPVIEASFDKTHCWLRNQDLLRFLKGTIRHNVEIMG